MNTKAHLCIIDDEKVLANMLKDELEYEGYLISVFYSANEFLREIEAGNVELTFDLIVCDSHMPGIEGLELLNHLHQNHPGQYRFVLSSGDTDIDLEDFRSKGGVKVLSKPYEFQDLIQNVDELLS